MKGNRTVASGRRERRRGRVRIRVLTAALLGWSGSGAFLGFSAVEPPATGEERVVVLGFDGADPDTIAAMIGEGELPNLARLAEGGSLAPLETTKPSESPVAWATFATGMNPGKTRIFDFLEKQEGSYAPQIALVREGSRELGRLPRFLVFVLISGTATVLGAWVIWRFGRLRPESGRLLALGAEAIPESARPRRPGFWTFLRQKQRPQGRYLLWMAVPAVVGSVGAQFVSTWIPEEVPQAIRARQNDAFWKITGAAGVETVALQAPMEFPVEETPGARILAGFGVPDVRKSFGLWSLYTTDLIEEESTETGGTRFPIRFETGEAHAVIRGPMNFTTGSHERWRRLVGGEAGREEVEVPLVFRHVEAGLEIEVQEQAVTLRDGEWSDFVRVRFRLNPLIGVDGLVRFRVLSLEPNLSVYMEPVNFDPSRLPFLVDLSWPRDFAEELAEQAGPFETIGWKIITNPLRDEAVDFDAFLEDTAFARESNERLLSEALADADWRLLVAVFLFPDRIQHMLYRFSDTEHPNHDPELAARYGGGIADAYRDMDRIVGETMDRVPPGTRFLVVSDHGFHSFRKQFNVNTWLAENGYLQAPEDPTGQRRLEDLFDPLARFFTGVDWSRSQAFALGLSGIYLNQQGREPQGVVAPGEEREALIERLTADLLAFHDPETGEPVVRSVHRREEIYEGPFVEEAPDLILGLEPGYRIGWQSTLGGFPEAAITPNLDNWSGDHCSMEDTAGVLVSNLPLREGALRDIAPTVLDLLGVSVPAEMDGISLNPR